MRKRILALVLAVLLLLCATVSFANPAPQGDANGDGKLTAADAAAILRHIVKLETLSPRQLANADFNFDGVVTANDAALILRYIVRLYTPPEKPKMTLADFPVLDGSTATIPLGTALVRYVTGCTEEEAEDRIYFSKTDYSYYELRNGYADLLLVYEAGNEVKEDLDFEEEFDIRPIGLDALVFIVNADNPVESLTTQQIRDIYSGKITNWKEVGGEDIEIVAFQRTGGSGSQTMMDKLVMGDTPMMAAPQDYVFSDMESMIYQTAAYYDNGANALGYSVYYYAKNMYAMPGLKFIAVDGVVPDEYSIAARAYPHINEFFSVLPKNPTKNAKVLRDWLLSDKGQLFIASCGYVPIRSDILPTPQPLPEPADHDLWDKDYFAVVPGDGGLVTVYDCRLRKVGSFTTRGLAYDFSPADLLTAEELAEKALFVNGKQRNLDFARAGLWTERYEKGFYRYDPEAGKLYVYDKIFNLRYTVDQEPEAEDAVGKMLDEGRSPRIKAIGGNDWILPYVYEDEEGSKIVIPGQLRSSDGTAIPCGAANIPGLDRALGDQYFVSEEQPIISEGSWKWLCNLYDFDGNLLLEDIEPVYYVGGDNCRYYVKDDVLYDAELNAVCPVLPGYNYNYIDYGAYVNGVVYDIGGVASTGEVGESGGWGSGKAFIQGNANGTLYAKQGEEIVSFPISAEDTELWYYNDNFALLHSKSQARYELRFRKSGAVHTIDAEEYVYFDISQNYFYVDSNALDYEYIIDENGEQYTFGGEGKEEYVRRALAIDVFILYRNGAFGIADLNGNFLIRAADDGWW